MALEKKYYSGSQVFDIIKELPEKEFLSMLNTFAKERGADVVEVVRCKDCEFYDEDEKWCRRLGLCGAFNGNDFCSHGEMKENDSAK